MKRMGDTAAIVQELAASMNQPEQLVSRLYAQALDDFGHDAKILDFVPLFAARRARDSLRGASSKSIQ